MPRPHRPNPTNVSDPCRPGESIRDFRNRRSSTRVKQETRPEQKARKHAEAEARSPEHTKSHERRHQERTGDW